MDVIDGDYIRTDSEWEELVWVWQQTDVPKGCKQEIIAGLITVQPVSARAHHVITWLVQRRLYEVTPDDWGIYQRLAAAVPSRLGVYVPDLMVVPRETLRAGEDEYFVPAARAALVVEITSKTTAHQDRTEKAAGYAEAGVPLYVLIDPLAPGGPTTTLYGEPGSGGYRLLQAGRFGLPITLPEPFGLTLDTSDFDAR